MSFPIQRSAAWLALAVSAAVAASCTNPGQPLAQTAGARGGQCFHAGQVNDFHPVRDHVVQVTVGARTLYELDVLGTCPEINWSNRIAIRSTGGSSWVCRGMDAEILMPGPGGLQRCPVLGVRKLSLLEAEAALRARRR